MSVALALEWLLGLGGFLLLALNLVDAGITIFSTEGGGPITHRLCKLSRLAFRGSPRGRLARRLRLHHGPILLVCVLLNWYLLNYLAWLCLFLTRDGAVVSSSTQSPADAAETLYFVGTGISTSGFGDYVAGHFPFTMMSNLTAFTASIIMTASLSYIFSVTTSAIDKKKLASNIASDLASLHSSAAHATSRELADRVPRIARALAATAQMCSAYPLMAFFNYRDPTDALDVQLYALLEVLAEADTDGELLRELSFPLDKYLANAGIFDSRSSEPAADAVPPPGPDEDAGVTGGYAHYLRALERQIQEYSIHHPPSR